MYSTYPSNLVRLVVKDLVKTVEGDKVGIGHAESQERIRILYPVDIRCHFEGVVLVVEEE